MKKLIQKWLGIREILDKSEKLENIDFSQVKGMSLVDITKIEERLDSLEDNFKTKETALKFVFDDINNDIKKLKDR